MSLRQNLLKVVCEKYEVTEGDLLSKRKAGVIGEARQAAVLVAYMEITKNKTIIAQWFGRKKCHSIAEILENAYGRHETDRAFRNQIQKITQQINEN